MIPLITCLILMSARVPEGTGDYSSNIININSAVVPLQSRGEKGNVAGKG